MAAGNDAHPKGGALAGAHPCRKPDCMPARNAPHGDRPSSSAHDGRPASDRACRHSALVPPCPAETESLLRPDPRAYAESLLAQADRFGLIDGAFRAGFQHRFGQLLRDLCRAYSGGRSASLRAETVRSISESALFAIGIRLKREESPLDALAAALPDEITPEAGLALLDRLGCASESVRRFAERICSGRGGELARLRKQTRAGSAQGEEFP